jgi:hypothetical protein
MQLTHSLTMPARDHAAGVVSQADILDLQIASQGNNDGRAPESTERNSQGGTLKTRAATFNPGADAPDRQYRAIQSFYSSSLPEDAIIKKATLKIKEQRLVGANPFKSPP